MKRELQQIPYYGWALALIKPIAIVSSAHQALRSVLEVGAARLRLRHTIS
jgi:hypothetical protein